MAAPTVRIPEFRDDKAHAVPEAGPDELARFLREHPRCLMISGAGCSTSSGIPAYRDQAGRWTRRTPIQYQAFMAESAVRQRYWARSYLGWPRIQSAQPNPSHRALADLEALGRVSLLLTQNVDGLHQRAGSRELLELHGGLDRVSCQGCGRGLSRALLQDQLQALNPYFQAQVQGINPDGDADLAEPEPMGFQIPDCSACGGVLKPDVVFFGENVPAARVERAWKGLQQADGVLVVGSSLVVFSAYRFVREAARRGLPVVSINQGRTRADPLLSFRLNMDAGQALTTTVDLLS